MQVSCSYTVNTVHILNIPGFVKCPGAGKKLAVKCPGAGNFFCANARGCPGGGMVRVGIERDISCICLHRCAVLEMVAPICSF